MLLRDKHIAIVGGGPGGLTLARLLQQQGASLHVYERDHNRHVRVQGATLDLHHDSGLLALERAGLMTAFRATYRPGADRVRVTDKHATIVFDDADGATDAKAAVFFRPEIDRGPLRDLLLDSLTPDTVIWDSHLLSLKPVGNAWQLLFANGTAAGADMVIAADGANSVVRPLLTPIQPVYAGVTIVEGNVPRSATTVPALHALLNGGKVFALGDSKTLILSSKGDGSLVFYTGCLTPPDWGQISGVDFADHAQVRAWFKRDFAGWVDMWLGLFDHADLPLVPRPQYCMPPDQRWEAQANLTMLGDAAHLMPPYAGEGVNMAMRDALTLSDCLTSGEFSDCRQAIAAFEAEMRYRAAEAARLTLAQTASLHSPDAIADLLDLFR